MATRVAVTGLGLVTPIGVGTAEFWDRLVAGTSGIRRIGGFDASTFVPAIGGEIPAEIYDPDRWLPDRKARKLTGRMVRLALGAAMLAVRDASLDLAALPGERTGVFMGANQDDMEFLKLCRLFVESADPADPGRLDLEGFARNGQRACQPLEYLRSIPNMAAAHIAIACQARGPNCTFHSLGTAGLQAVGEATLAVGAGEADVMLAGGTDSWVQPETLRKAASLGTLSRRDDPRACRPFGADRDGIVVGEGAGVLVLERLDRAAARGARVYGEVLGYGTAVDASDFPEAAQPAAGPLLAMERALARARLGPAALDYVHAHGEGSPAGDRAEATAIGRLLGSRRRTVPVGALKSLTGHLGAASGAVELIATLLAMERGLVPPGRVGAIDPACDLDVAPVARAHRVDVALCHAMVTGGLSAAVVLGRAPEGAAA
jgi:3-oxoacyl-(acyl-carrier-protein) synthase